MQTLLTVLEYLDYPSSFLTLLGHSNPLKCSLALSVDVLEGKVCMDVHVRTHTRTHKHTHTSDIPGILKEV